MLQNEKLLKHREKIEKVRGKKFEIPTLDDPEELWVMSVFSALNSQRKDKYAPLEFVEIAAYMNITAVPAYERTFLLRMLLSLDNVYRQYVEETKDK